jgi:RimJ/RimL family protein N-acetyltransferase
VRGLGPSFRADGSIETERLVLRPVSLSDVDEFVSLDSDPQVMRYLNGGKPTPRSEVEEGIRQHIGYRWSGYDRPTCDFVGWFGGRPTGEGEYELGYRLARRAWGKGLATEGSLAVVARAFGELGASRVWAQTMAINTRSRRVMERCGLTYVRTFHLDWDDPIEGTEHGEVEYELLREDWLAGQPPPLTSI